jgi:hypothetical protein
MHDDRNARVLALLEAGGLSHSAIAAQVGCTKGVVSGISNRRRARKGELGYKPVLPGFEITRTSSVLDADGDLKRSYVTQAPAKETVFQMPEGHALAGVSSLTDGDGRVIVQWTKTKPAGEDRDRAIEAIRAAFEDVVAPYSIAQPSPGDADLLTLYPLADWHLGMFAWGRETDRNWDLKIAERVIGSAMAEVISRSPSADTAVVLGGGDMLHSDNKSNQTAKSGNPLDVDGRYQKVLGVACRLIVRTIDMALQKHSRVRVRILQGNHDEHSSIALTYFLMGWYREESRVVVDDDPSLFWWMRHGEVLLGATHGHTVKIADMPQIMAHRRAQDWGVTRHRYVHGFHLHHSAKLATEGGGVISEIHRSPVPQDAWHHGAGFLSGRSIQSITYHARHGERGRVQEAVMDDLEDAG